MAQEIIGKKNRGRIHLLVHDYGASVAQELISRSLPGLASICFLNGGILPEIHRPVLVQKALASPLGFVFGLFLSRSLFGMSFGKVWGRKPTQQELDEYWSIIQFNRGHRIFCYLIAYMAERSRNKQRWVEAIHQDSKALPMALLNGPADPVSGRHLAVALSSLWKVPLTPSSHAPPSISSHRRVIVLPDRFGHYPQVECPSMVISHFYQFIQDQSFAQVRQHSKITNIDAA